MSRPRILYVATEDWYFVSDTLPLACAARDAGYDVCVAAHQGPQHRAIVERGLKFLPLAHMSRAGIGPLAQAASVKELRALIANLAPDIVHNIALKPTLYSALTVARPAPAVVNSIMGMGFVFTSQSAKAQVLRPIVWQALKRAVIRPRALTLVQNQDDFEHLKSLGNDAQGKLILIKGSGVDTAMFAPTPEPAGAPVVVLAGRLLKHKGVVEFVEAARILRSQGVAVRFALVGDIDPDNAASVTRTQLDRWVKEGAVEHWGFRNDMPKVYRDASIVCLPSYREGLPRVLLEGAASGRAIVATDVPGCREVVRNGVNGRLVPARNATALAAALADVVTQPSQRLKMAAAGRKMIEAEFAAPIIINKTLALYAQLLAEPY